MSKSPRLYFRFPVPKATGTAELTWRQHPLGRVEIPVVTPEQFQSELRLHLPTAFVNVLGRSVAAQTFVTTQQQGLTASGLLTSPTGLIPLLDLGLTATFRTARGTKTVVTPVPLTASQLAGREAQLKNMEDDRKEMARQLQELRERLAKVEGVTEVKPMPKSAVPKAK